MTNTISQMNDALKKLRRATAPIKPTALKTIAENKSAIDNSIKSLSKTFPKQLSPRITLGSTANQSLEQIKRFSKSIGTHSNHLASNVAGLNTSGILDGYGSLKRQISNKSIHYSSLVNIEQKRYFSNIISPSQTAFYAATLHPQKGTNFKNLANYAQANFNQTAKYSSLIVNNSPLNHFAAILDNLGTISGKSLTVSSVSNMVPNNSYQFSKRIEEITKMPAMASYIHAHNFQFSGMDTVTLSKIINNTDILNLDSDRLSQALKGNDNSTISVVNSVNTYFDQAVSKSIETSQNGKSKITAFFTLIFFYILNSLPGVIMTDIDNHFIDLTIASTKYVLVETGLQSPNGYVTSYKLPVHSGHTQHSRIITSLPFKQKVAVIKNQGKWSKIKIKFGNDSRYGWVKTNCLDINK